MLGCTLAGLFGGIGIGIAGVVVWQVVMLLRQLEDVEGETDELVQRLELKVMHQLHVHPVPLRLRLRLLHLRLHQRLRLLGLRLLLLHLHLLVRLLLHLHLRLLHLPLTLII